MMTNTGSHKGLPLHAHDRPNWYGTLSHCGGTTVDSDEKTTLENELLFAVVKERYGSLLTDEQLDEVRKSALGPAELHAAAALDQAYERHRAVLDVQAVQG